MSILSICTVLCDGAVDKSNEVGLLQFFQVVLWYTTEGGNGFPSRWGSTCLALLFCVVVDFLLLLLHVLWVLCFHWGNRQWDAFSGFTCCWMMVSGMVEHRLCDTYMWFLFITEIAREMEAELQALTYYWIAVCRGDQGWSVAQPP